MITVTMRASSCLSQQRVINYALTANASTLAMVLEMDGTGYSTVGQPSSAVANEPVKADCPAGTNVCRLLEDQSFPGGHCVFRLES